MVKVFLQNVDIERAWYIYLFQQIQQIFGKMINGIYRVIYLKAR